MINEIRSKIADFLNIHIVSNWFLFINFWSVIHFISGGIVMFFVMKVFKKRSIERKFLILFVLLILYEIFESSVIYLGSGLFRGEVQMDVIWDLVFGMFGGFTMTKLVKKFKF